jgi:hypothetical protein
MPPPSQLVDSAIEQAPWDSIFHLLLDPYMRKTREEGFSDQEVVDIERTLQAYSLVCSIPALQSHFSTFFDVVRGAEAVSIRRAALFVEMKQPHANSYLFDDLCTIFMSMDCLPTEFLHAHLLHLQKRQREEPNQDDVVINFLGKDGEKRQNLAQVLHFDFTALNCATISEPLQDTLFDILAARYMITPPTRDTPIERYSCAFETFVLEEPDAGNKVVAMEIHNAIMSQILGKALQEIRRSKHVSPGPTMLRLGHLLNGNPSYVPDAKTVRAIFQILNASEMSSGVRSGSCRPGNCIRVCSRRHTPSVETIGPTGECGFISGFKD